MKPFIIAIFLVSFLSSPAQKPDTTNIFDQMNDFLLKEVVFGLIDYGSLQQDPDELNRIINQIENYDLKGVGENHKTAFYLNAYNLLVIKQVTDKYPIGSPMDIGGFFKINTFKVAGETLTLDAIEFTKLIEPTQDPRIHFGLGCGARSCPFLYDKAFYPDRLDEQLDFRAQVIIDRPNYVYVDYEKNEVLLNKIFDWYKDQFEEHSGSLIAYVNKYRSSEVPDYYQVQFQEYDWSLNDR